MIDFPTIGLGLLNDAQSRAAETSETSDEFESADAVFEALKGITGRTELRKALSELYPASQTRITAERDVVRSLMETRVVGGLA